MFSDWLNSVIHRSMGILMGLSNYLYSAHPLRAGGPFIQCGDSFESFKTGFFISCKEEKKSCKRIRFREL